MRVDNRSEWVHSHGMDLKEGHSPMPPLHELAIIFTLLFLASLVWARGLD